MKICSTHWKCNLEKQLTFYLEPNKVFETFTKETYTLRKIILHFPFGWVYRELWSSKIVGWQNVQFFYWISKFHFCFSWCFNVGAFTNYTERKIVSPSRVQTTMKNMMSLNSFWVQIASNAFFLMLCAISRCSRVVCEVCQLSLFWPSHEELSVQFFRILKL